MRGIETHISSTPQRALWEAGGFLNEKLHGYQDVPLLLLLSGGSSLELFEYVNYTLFEHVTFGLVDERLRVGPEDQNMAAFLGSNFHQYIKETPVIGISESAFRQWYRNHPGGYTIAVLGVGKDGHTAGIMADAPKDGGKWVLTYETHLNQFPHRKTVTNTFLMKKVDLAIVYAVGEDKAHALVHLSEGPARIIREMKYVVLFTDRAAAGTLEP